MAQSRWINPPDSRRIDRTSRPIDQVHLARQTLGDRALEHEVLRMFDKQVNLYFERVRASTVTDELVMGLHTLKGASLGIGAMALAELVREAERELAARGAVDEETLDDIGMAVAEVSAYIRSIVKD